MARLRVGVVGVGHLGKEHARILAGMSEVELVGVVDVNAAQAESVAQRCGTRGHIDHAELLGAVEAAVIATPTSQHHAVACDFLSRGIPLLIEKPLASSRAQADELVALARRHNTILQVGHIERFNPAFEELLRHPLQPKLITCERYSGFSGRSTDIGVVLDLMIHDIDLVLALVQAPVVSVQALGVSVLGGHEDLAQTRLVFASGCVADLMASRVHPTSVRRLRAWGPEGCVELDLGKRNLTLIQLSEQLQQRQIDSRRLDPLTLNSLKAELYSRHLQVQQLSCNEGDQLTRELRDFVRCVRTGSRPRVDGAAGRDALVLAGQILDSLRAHCWDGKQGPTGPSNLPAPLGRLFTPAAPSAAA